MTGNGIPQPGGSGGANNHVVVVEFDKADAPDQSEAGNKLNQIANLLYDKDNVDKWFRRLERRMETGGVRLQWTKRLVLESALPAHLHADLDDLFDLTQAGCGQIYYECKTTFLEIHGPRPDRDLDIALTMVMTSDMTPSQAAQRLVKLICKDKKPLENCCCAILVSSRWRKMLPSDVRAHVANFDLKTDYAAAMKVADGVWRSLQEASPQVAVVNDARAGQTPKSDSFESEVAAVSSRGANRSRGRGPRRGRGGNRGGQRNSSSGSGQNQDGPIPPDNCCYLHKRFKKNAYYCQDPDNCPWKNYTNPPNSASAKNN